LETFSGNPDWPKNNVRLIDLDGKWRFVLHDLDLALGYSEGLFQINLFSSLHQRNNFPGLLYQALIRDKEFKKDFIQRVNTLFQSQLSQEKWMEKIDSIQNQIKPVMKLQTRRWRKPENLSIWLEQVNQIRDFIRKRYEIYQEQLKKEFRDQFFEI
jgi:hypothetical protein